MAGESVGLWLSDLPGCKEHFLIAAEDYHIWKSMSRTIFHLWKLFFHPLLEIPLDITDRLMYKEAKDYFY
jgi:hypothetical protein